jgi:DNA-binding GntR family transcriptional regulator
METSQRAVFPSGGYPAEQRTRVDEAYTLIREMIRSRQLQGGSTILEAQLAREFDMSRTPVREALTRLASEGFLRPATGRGYVIAELTAEDLVNVYAVRAELEGLAAAEAAKRIRRVDVARLEDLYDDMAVALKKGDDGELAMLNSDFHATVATISGNSYLKAMLDDIRKIFDHYRPLALTVPGRRDDAHVEHGELIEALRTHDEDLARRVAKLHVERALSTRQAALDLGTTG